MSDESVVGIVIFVSIIGVIVLASGAYKVVQYARLKGAEKGLMMFGSFPFVLMLLGVLSVVITGMFSEMGSNMDIAASIYWCSVGLATVLNVAKGGWRTGIPFSLVQMVTTWIVTIFGVFLLAGLMNGKKQRS